MAAAPASSAAVEDDPGSSMKGAAIPLLLGACAVLCWTQQPEPFDPVLEAMRAELLRARSLSLPNQPPPYFIQYLTRGVSSFSITATMGALISRSDELVLQPEVRVRAGDYGFDGEGAGGGGGAVPGVGDYDLLRRYLWLSTDAAYRSAIEAFSRKRTAAGGGGSEELSRAATVKRLPPLPPFPIDTELWCERARSISALLAKYPELKDSGVEVESRSGGFTLVNSEGTEVREPEAVTRLRIYAAAQAPDGMLVGDEATFLALDMFHLPAELESTRAVETVAANTRALASAPRGEGYSGPVLFEGMASAQLFAEALGPAVAGNAPEMQIGVRVLPAFFDVVDDPTQTEWRGRNLFGSYGVDHEGVIPSPLRVIEKGVLKAQLTTRRSAAPGAASNGRSRLPGGGSGVSNLFVGASEVAPVAELRKKLLALCAERGKPYGVIIRKMAFGRQSAPLLAYRIFADGREELVRGLASPTIDSRQLSHIVAAGDDMVFFEFSSGADAVVVAPSVLMDAVDLRPAQANVQQLPALPPPDLSKR
jgi:TldD protein